MTKPEDIAKTLIEIFPDFEKEWDEGEGFGYSDGQFSAHSIFLTFGPVANELLEKSSCLRLFSF